MKKGRLGEEETLNRIIAWQLFVEVEANLNVNIFVLVFVLESTANIQCMYVAYHA